MITTGIDIRDSTDMRIGGPTGKTVVLANSGTVDILLNITEIIVKASPTNIDIDDTDILMFLD